MPNAVSNTSPLLYLYRIELSEWIPLKIAPLVDRLRDTGMWISDEIQQRILVLAGEK
jgi:hypothetical protein